MRAPAETATSQTLGTRLHALLQPLARGSAGLLLVMLLSVDALLITAHLAQKFLGQPSAWFYDLGADHSWNEMYLATKWIWIALLGLMVWQRRRAPVFLALAAVSALLLLEDTLMLHERVGWRLEPWLTERIPALEGRPLVAFQVGELLWFGILIGAISLLALVGWLRSDRESRRHAAAIAFFFAAFTFFAVVIDTWHSFFEHGTVADSLLTALEDGGELAAMSPPVAYLFWLARQPAGPVDADADRR